MIGLDLDNVVVQEQATPSTCSMTVHSVKANVNLVNMKGIVH
jgi:hypothetical protein